MLTRKQKALLERRIYDLIKESIFENGFDENFFMEKKEKSHEKDDKGEERNLKSKKSSDERDTSGKKDLVYKWLDSAQELHSVLSYELYPNMTKDAARSLFSKKYNGESQGKEYEFNELEINKLFNMRDTFIDKAGFDNV